MKKPVLDFHSGIYSIRCIMNNKIYIGLSKDLSVRKDAHFFALRKNRHHNKHLQNSFNKYGEENFVFEIIEYCAIKFLGEREIYWILQLNALNIQEGFNMNQGGGNNTSSTSQWKKVLLYNKKGVFVKSFLNTADCDRFLKIRKNATSRCLESATMTIANGHYVRNWDGEQDFPKQLDILYIKNIKTQNRVRAGKASALSKKNKIDQYHQGLLSAEELSIIITGELSEDNIQSHGIDLQVIQIKQLSGKGVIPKIGKTKLCSYTEKVLKNIKIDGQNRRVWALGKGVYDVTFKQGCVVPPFAMLLIRQRSSLLRNGAIIHSSIFDAGFNTKNIGTIMVVNIPIIIEYEARIANIYGHRCVAVKALYNGQFQKDSQRISNTGKAKN